MDIPIYDAFIIAFIHCICDLRYVFCEIQKWTLMEKFYINV